MLGMLPDRLLLHIRDCLLHDLQAHIALSQTSSKLREFYLHDDAFWQLACFSAGYGRPLQRSTFSKLLSWREIALSLAAHSHVCEIRSCREANVWLGEFRFSLYSFLFLLLPVISAGASIQFFLFSPHPSRLSGVLPSSPTDLMGRDRCVPLRACSVPVIPNKITLRFFTAFIDSIMGSWAHITF